MQIPSDTTRPQRPLRWLAEACGSVQSAGAALLNYAVAVAADARSAGSSRRDTRQISATFPPLIAAFDTASAVRLENAVPHSLFDKRCASGNTSVCRKFESLFRASAVSRAALSARQNQNIAGTFTPQFINSVEIACS